jgi:hypothetical protein
MVFGYFLVCSDALQLTQGAFGQGNRLNAARCGTHAIICFASDGKGTSKEQQYKKQSLPLMVQFESAMGLFVELLKITIPAVLVGGVAYLVLRTLLQQQNTLKARELQVERQGTTLPLRLQAYERLSVLVERLAIPGLVLRTSRAGMQSATLKIALLMNIQQEFEHNISQQVYVSDQLWSIIKATRDDAVQFIELVGEKVDKKADAQTLASALLQFADQREGDPVATAQTAIRREAASLFY